MIVRLAFALALVAACIARPAIAATHVDGAHPHDANEWWHVVGRVHASNGKDYAYMLAIFRSGVLPHAVVSTHARRESRWLDPTVFSATLSFVDERAETVDRSERHVRGALGLGAASPDRRAIRVDDWFVTQDATETGNGTPFNLIASSDRVKLRLHGILQKPAVSLSADEWIATSIGTSGTIEIAGVPLRVTGKSWYDHTFGHRATAPNIVGWDRMRVQLDDGRELLFESDRVRGTTIGAARAFVIDKRGALSRVAQPHRRARAIYAAGWRSLRTGARYPDLWSVYIPGVTQMLSLELVTRDQEFRSERGEPFYCGVADVFDVTPGSDGKRLGTGFVELTGYATPVELATIVVRR